MLQQLALFGHIVERCSSALLLSEEILSSLLMYSVRNGFDYRKKREAERSCEFIFRIDFCRNFYPEVLGTSWMPALNINILCTEPLLCKSQSPHSQSKILPLVYLSAMVSSLHLQWAQHETLGKRIIWIFICSGNFVTAFIHPCRDEQPAKPAHQHNTLSWSSEIWGCTSDWL